MPSPSSLDRPLSVAPASAIATPGRKPMATARRVTLFEREVRYRLSAAAIDILFDQAEVLSEGQVQAGPDGGGYFGSTMITLELGRVAPLVREDCDPATARRLADLIGADPRVRARARAVAVSQAERRAGRPFAHLDVDLSVRAAGTHVQIDLDVEGGVGA